MNNHIAKLSTIKEEFEILLWQNLRDDESIGTLSGGDIIIVFEEKIAQFQKVFSKHGLGFILDYAISDDV